MNRREAIADIIRRMESLPNFKQTGNTYRSASPVRPGSDGDSFTFTLTSDGYAVWHDHKEDVGGGLLDLCKALGITIEDGRAPVEETLRAYRDLAEYAAAQGVEAQIFIEAGWSAQPMQYQNRPALSYPTTKGVHLRFIDGQKPKYKPAHTGDQRCWYGLDRAIRMATERDSFIVLANGAPSVIVAQHYGLPAAAVIGGENALTPELLTELRNKWQGGVVICLDCDDKGRAAAKKVEAQLIGSPVAVMDLRLSDKGDLAQYCKLHGDDTYTTFYSAAPHPKAVSQVELMAAQAVQDLARASAELTKALRADAEQRRSMDVDALVSRVKSDLERVQLHTSKAVVTPVKSIVQRNREAMRKAKANQQRILGLRTGIPTLDYHLRGLLNGDVNVIYGAASMGKSTLAVSITAHLMDQGYGIVVPTESQPERWLNKLVAACTRIPLARIDAGELNEIESQRVEDAYTRIERTINLDFLEGTRPTPQQIHTAVLEHKPKWLVIDSGSNLLFPGAPDIYNRTVGVSGSLQDTALEANIPILMTWQTNRGIGDRKKGEHLPRLDDGQGGAVVEQDPARVIAVYNHQYYVDEGSEDPNPDFPPGQTLVKVLKDRWYGAKGRSVMLKYVEDAALVQLETRPAILQREAVGD